MPWEPSQALQEWVRQLTNKRVGEYLQKRESTLASVRRTLSRRLPSNSPAPQLADAVARLTKELLDNVLADAVRAVREQGRLTDESRDWLVTELSRATPSLEALWCLVEQYGQAPHPRADVVKLNLGRALDRLRAEGLSDLAREASADKVRAECTERTQPVPVRVVPPIDERDRKIIDALASRVPAAAASYEQAARDLAGDRRSWRGPACDLREALRETLDSLAPDEEVKAQKGFKPVPDTRGPTMQQKAAYVLRQRHVGKNVAKAVEDAVERVEMLIGGFLRSVYARSSISVHTAAGRREVEQLHDLVRVALVDLIGDDTDAQEPVTAGHQTAAATRTQEADADSSPHESS